MYSALPTQQNQYQTTVATGYRRKKPLFFNEKGDCQIFFGYGLITLVFFIVFLGLYFGEYLPSKKYDAKWIPANCNIQNLYNQTFYPRCPFDNDYSRICFQWNIDYSVYNTANNELFNVSRILQVKQYDLIQNVFLYMQPHSNVSCKYNKDNQDSCIDLLDECESRIKNAGIVGVGICLGIFGGLWLLFSLTLCCLYFENTKRWREELNPSSTNQMY